MALFYRMNNSFSIFLLVRILAASRRFRFNLSFLASVLNRNQLHDLIFVKHAENKSFIMTLIVDKFFLLMCVIIHQLCSKRRFFFFIVHQEFHAAFLLVIYTCLRLRTFLDIKIFDFYLILFQFISINLYRYNAWTMVCNKLHPIGYWHNQISLVFDYHI